MVLNHLHLDKYIEFIIHLIIYIIIEDFNQGMIILAQKWMRKLLDLRDREKEFNQF